MKEGFMRPFESRDLLVSVLPTVVQDPACACTNEKTTICDCTNEKTTRAERRRVGDHDLDTLRRELDRVIAGI